ncbi:hypothetical protein VPHK567_0187 [Vibrio phage K567]
MNPLLKVRERDHRTNTRSDRAKKLGHTPSKLCYIIFSDNY